MVGCEISTWSPEPFPDGGGATTPPSKGVHGLSSAMSIAQDASIKPKPHSLFQRLETDVSEALSCWNSEEFLMISLISKASSEGLASITVATTPDAIGVAILVPSFSS